MSVCYVCLRVARSVVVVIVESVWDASIVIVVDVVVAIVGTVVIANVYMKQLAVVMGVWCLCW